LRLEPGNVARFIGLPKPLDEGAGASEFRIAINQDQGCIHHTVFRVYSVVVSMGAEEPDRHSARAILEGRNVTRPCGDFSARAKQLQ
jgi:hypothetical protein